jgi:predicted RNA-binding Zn-ribbon protein involved in translation (DUF1610 family)
MEEQAMKNGPCPKCGSKEIYVNRGSDTSFRNMMYLDWWTRNVHVNDYICAKCGFIESYLENMEDMEKIITKCEKA